MGWAPNADAAVWIADEVWPLVRARVPGARLLLVGRDPTPAVRARAGTDVEVTGTVDDVRPFLARARVALAPLRAGGGSRVKILEALDGGRPVVATSIGAEGLGDLVGRGVVLADEPGAMADALVGLLVDRDRAEGLGRAGREAVAARHSWEGTLAPYKRLLSGLST
jgi:glycosyltransferase involved in cell wall biosynthesis